MQLLSLLGCFRGKSRPTGEPTCLRDPLPAYVELHGISVNAGPGSLQTGQCSEKQIHVPPTDEAPSTLDAAAAVTLLNDSHASPAELKTRDQALRERLDNATKSVQVQSKQVTSLPSSSSPDKLFDPDVSRLKDQLIQCCCVQRPGADAFDRVSQLLADLRTWLSSATSEDSAIVMLYGSGEALARSEHMARSAGQVKFWPAPAVHALVALMQTYSALMERCPADHPLPTPAHGQGRGQAPAGSSSIATRSLSETLAQMLMRPDLVELLVEVLQLVHFDESYAAGCEKGVAAGTAMSLWGFMRDLVRFAGVHSGVVEEKNLAGCMEQLARLLSPKSGVIPRLLVQPPTGDTLAVQLAVLQTLQQLFDAPQALVQQLFRADPAAGSSPGSIPELQAASGSGVTPPLPSDPASFYASYHLQEAARCYHAAEGDAASAAAELSMLHLLLMRSLVLSNSPVLLSSVNRAGAVDFLLGEIALQFDAAGATAASMDDERGAADDDSSEGSGDTRNDVQSAPSLPAVPAMRQAGPDKPFTGNFEFSYDLNEDLERIMELEDQLGSTIPLNGFEYDDEGRQMLERNALMAQRQLQLAAAEEAAVTAERASSNAEEAVGEGAVQPLAEQLPSFSRRAYASDGGSRPLIPKLSFTAMSMSAVSRTASVTSPCPSAVHSQRNSAKGAPPRPSAFRPPLNPETPKNANVAQDSVELAPPVPAPLPLDGCYIDEASSALLPSQDDAKLRDSAPARFTSVTPGRALPSLPRDLPLIPALDFSILASSGSNRASARGPAMGGGGQKTNSSRQQTSQHTGRSSSQRQAAQNTGVPTSSRVPGSASRGAMTSGRDQVGGEGGSAAFYKDRRDPEDATLTAISPAQAGRETLPGSSSLDLLPLPSDAAAAVGLPQQAASQRLLVTDARINVALLRLTLELLVTCQGSLELAYWLQYPLDHGKRYNLEYLLTWHLSAGPGSSVVLELMAKLREAGGQARLRPVGDPLADGDAVAAVSKVDASVRLLRLLSRSLFDEGRYSELKFQARGAFGSVFRAKMKEAGGQQQVMIKTIELPSSSYDRCIMPDIYGEVHILEQYKGCRGICQLIDYGLAPEAYWIVMKRYRCSLAEWRQKQTTGPTSAAAAALLISILLQVVGALQILARDSVVHFDLKCSNVLIDPLPGIKDSELWNPLATSPAPSVAPFEIVLADFGEARSYRSAEEAFTVRNRGTEVYKSPEMLMLNNADASGVGPGSWTTAGALPSAGSSQLPAVGTAAAAAKAALQGAGLASDVWSLGCLAYELFSGAVLFGGDYASVTHRVAFGGRGNLLLTVPERAALGDRGSVIDLVEWVLARDPAKRPSLAAIAARLGELHQQLRTEVDASGVHN